jgi:uncharacterized membrane protein
MNFGHSCETSREILAYPYPGRSAKITSGRGLPGQRISKKLMLRVRPGVELVRASLVPTRELITLDLPTLDRPKKATSGIDGAGKWETSVAAAMNRDKTLISKFATLMQSLASDGASVQCVRQHSAPTTQTRFCKMLTSLRHAKRVSSLACNDDFQIDAHSRRCGMVTAASPRPETVSSRPSILPAAAHRLVSIDVLRGLVMVIMALDHARDFLTYSRSAPEDVAHTSAALFFTRFITHFCAPVFAFLAGAGAFLSTRRGKSLKQVSWFFFTRGLWLLFLEFTVVGFGWGFVPWTHGGVIWILGWSMVVMAAIVWLPTRWIAVLGVGMIATHNLLDPITPASFGTFYWLWMLPHSHGRIPITDHFAFSVRYVLIPWVGVMAAGFAFGALLQRPDRRKWILTIGICATALFFLLRGINLYGNGLAGGPGRYAHSAGPWSVQSSFSLTVISFFNTLKYPPALDYLLMTLGPALILLGLLDGTTARGWMARILMVFGRVPMFYYLLHIYLLNILALVTSIAFHQPIWHGTVIADFAQRPLGYGHGLPFIYAMWLTAVAILYLPCRWFMELRSRHRDWTWLSYL